MGFVRNAWYVAGWASEFGRDLRRVTILGEDLVMYRTAAGAVVALHDRCPHRFLPLSRGRLVGDLVQCGYHGTSFGADGRCTHVPGQRFIPTAARVHAYRVHERRAIVWVWMGDPARAEDVPVFDLAQMSDPDWHMHQGDALHIRSSYLNVAENLLDPAHVAYVHPTTLGNASHKDIPVQYDTAGDPIVASRWIRNAPPIRFFQEYAGFTGNVDRWQYFYLYLPSTAVIDFGSADASLNIADSHRHEGTQVFALHFLTPVSAGYTIDRWMHIRKLSPDDDRLSRKMDDMFRVAFAEDKAVLESIQEEEDKAGTPPTLHLAIDKGAIAYRARIADMMAREQQKRPA